MNEREHGPRGGGPGEAFAGARLHIVTGKGGTGKTTAATALALALATGGGRVLLVEVEGRQGVASLLGSAPLPYEEHVMLSAPGGGSVSVLAADAEAALLEYLEMFYGMRRAGQALTKLGAVDFATTIAPGLRDVLLTGKATEAVRRREGGRRSSGGPHRYDAVVMDAPPTGRIGRFLNVNSEVAGLARVGPIHKHAERAMSVIRSERTRVHFVTLLEEMPAQETRDGIAEIEALGLRPGAVLVNMVGPRLLGEVELAAAAVEGPDEATLTDGMEVAGLADPTGLAADLAGEVRSYALRHLLELRVRGELEDVGRPLVELPRLEGGMDRAALVGLARRLSEQGVRR
ncbi:ArsA-related P-loop ATPase [Nocardiopsis sp. NPDC006832]|uniref:ArsA-related P-loop ATPase n=1 Tax=Nocardiopsis sp. NPDC006832 TaxID=3157188 RepID=UPI0033F5A675